MAVKTTDFVGYRGFVKFNEHLVLAQSGNATFQTTPIASQGNWGAGSWNAAERVAWEGDFPEVQASFTCDVTAGAVIKDIEEKSSRFAISEGAVPIEIHPANRWGFSGSGFVDQLTLKGDEKQNMTADLQLKSYFTTTQSVKDFNAALGDEGTATDRKQQDTGLTAGEQPLNGSGNSLPYNGLFPYWGHNVYLALPTEPTAGAGAASRMERKKCSEITWGNPVDNITSWSANFQHNIQFKKTCGIRDGAPTATDGWPLQPDYVALGQMTGSCDLSYIGTINEYNYQTFFHVRSMKVTYRSPIETEAEAANHGVAIPAMVCESYPMEVSTGGDFITANFSYQPIGNGFEPPVLLLAWLAATP